MQAHGVNGVIISNKVLNRMIWRFTLVGKNICNNSHLSLEITHFYKLVMAYATVYYGTNVMALQPVFQISNMEYYPYLVLLLQNVCCDP